MIVDVVLGLRSVFISLAATIAIANALPGVSSKFIVYGPRESADSRVTGQDSKKDQTHVGSCAKLVDYVSSLRVPHSWFYHFYLLSVMLSIFWAVQIVVKGSVFEAIVSYYHRDPGGRTSMTVRQVLVTWTMMFIQGARRLYESVVFAKQSSSKMWIAHWAVGLAFYFCTSVAVWIEGIDALVAPRLPFHKLVAIQPTIRSLLAIPMFLVGSGIQFDCHHYLFSLEKYTLPEHPMFQLLICPHYTAECLIYLSLAIVAAPTGKIINETIACAFIFVFVNLAVTARNTRQWYAARFGGEKINQRWTMLPMIW